MRAAQDRLVLALEALLDSDGSWHVVPSPGCSDAGYTSVAVSSDASLSVNLNIER